MMKPELPSSEQFSRRRWGWGRVCLYAVLLVLGSAALHAVSIACAEDFTWWFSASGWLVLISLCLLLLWLAVGVWLRRRLREMVLVALSVLVLCWYYRGFLRLRSITCASGAAMRPPSVPPGISPR